MQFSAYFLLPLIFYIDCVLCEYRRAQETALRFPGFLVLPALIISHVSNDKRNEYTKIAFEENNENVIAPNGTESILNNKVQEDNRVTDASFRQALYRGNGLHKDLRQIRINETSSEIGDFNNNLTIMEDDEVITPVTTTLDPDITTELYTTTEVQGIYSNSRYNNTDINSLAVTIKYPKYTLYPPLKDEQWKKFTMSTNISITNENITKPQLTNSLNFTGYPSANELNSQIKGVYKASLYNNADIDQLSITTNSYTNELALPPLQDERWSNFSSWKKMLPPSNEFRPLAGLYYDGFLHRPVTKSPGFMPYNYYYFN